MNDRVAGPEPQLREAFVSREGGAEVDLDRVQRAVDGRLSPTELREMIDRLADDPALAEAWRLARALRAELGGEPGSERHRSGARHSLLLTAAAAGFALVAALSGWHLSTLRTSRPEIVRGEQQQVIETLLDAGGTLSRDRFVLRWASSLDDPWFEVQVLDANLGVLFQQRGLGEPIVTVPEESLGELEAGAEVLWRVEAVDTDGGRHVSATFHQRLR